MSAREIQAGLAPIAAKSIRFVAIAYTLNLLEKWKIKNACPLDHCIGSNGKLITFWNMRDSAIIPNTEINKVLVTFLY